MASIVHDKGELEMYRQYVCVFLDSLSRFDSVEWSLLFHKQENSITPGPCYYGYLINLTTTQCTRASEKTAKLRNVSGFLSSRVCFPRTLTAY